MRINKSLITYIPSSGSGSGSVTSVALTAPTGFSVSGSPITSSGTLALSFAAGYSLPTTTKQGQWDSAYAFTSTFPTGTAQQLLRVNTLGTALEFFTPNFLVSTDIIATTPLVWNSTTNTMSIPAATSSVNGYLTSADWLTFSSKQPAITLTTTGNSGASTFNVITGALNIPEYTLAGLGGMGNPMTSLGDMIYGNAVGIPLRVAANTTTTKKYLSMTGDGTSGDQPFWDTITGFIGGSGTTGYIPKFTSSTAIGNSLIYDDGTNIGIATISPTYKLDVSGTLRTTGNVLASNVISLIGAENNSAKIKAGKFLSIADDGFTVGINYTSDSIPFGGYNLMVNGNTYNNGTFYNNSNASIGTPTQDARLRVAGAMNSTQAIFGNVDGRGLAISTVLVAGTNEAGSILNARGVGGGTFIVQTDGTERVRVASTGQLKLNAYTSVSSFSGTIAGLLAFDSSGNVIARNNVVDLTLSTTGNNGAATYNTITGALNIPEYTLDGLGGMGNPMTSLGDMIYGNAVGIPLRVPANTTTTKKFLAMTGDGTSGDQPFWETITSGVSGTTNYVAKFTSSTAVGNSLIYDNGTSVLINTTSTTGETLQVNGSTKITSGLSVDSTTLVVDATNDRVGVGSASPNARLQISGGSLATGGSGAMISTNLSTGRLDSYDTNSVACLHTYLDAHSYEISAGSTANYISGISITGGGATLHTGTIRMFANSLERFTLKTTGQIALTAYNSATSFTGTPVAYLACDSSGNIITSNPSGIAKYMSVALSTVGNTWLDMPAALSFFDSSNAYVTQLELSSFNQVRLVVNKLGTAGATGSKLILRYQDTTGAPFTASSYSDIGTSEVSVTVDVANNILVSSWINLATAAKDDVWVALLGIDGDGAIDPTFGNIYAEFRYNP